MIRFEISVRHPDEYGQCQLGMGFEAPEKGCVVVTGGVNCVVGKNMDPGASSLTHVFIIGMCS